MVDGFGVKLNGNQICDFGVESAMHLLFEPQESTQNKWFDGKKMKSENSFKNHVCPCFCLFFCNAGEVLMLKMNCFNLNFAELLWITVHLSYTIRIIPRF